MYLKHRKFWEKFSFKVGLAPYFLNLAWRHHCSCRKSLKWCSKSKSSSCCLVEVVHANNKMYTLLKPLLMHVLYSFSYSHQCSKYIISHSFGQDRRKKFKKIMDHNFGPCCIQVFVSANKNTWHGFPNHVLFQWSLNIW